METKTSQPLILILLLTVGLYLSGFLIFLTPLPLVYTLLRRGVLSFYATAFTAILAVALFYIFGFENLQQYYSQNNSLYLAFPLPFIELATEFPHPVLRFWGIGYFVFFVLMSYFVAVVLTHPKKGVRLTFFFALSLFLGVIVINLVFILPQAEILLTQLRVLLTQGLQKMIEVQEKSENDITTVLYLKNSLPVLVDYTVFLMPSYLLSRIALVFILNIILARRFLGKIFPEINLLSYARLRIPFVVVWFLIVSFIAFLLNDKITQISVLHFLLLNCFIVVALAYFLQGFVVLDFILDARKARPFTRFFIYASIYLLAPVMIVILTGLGFFDSWMDVRKLDRLPPSSQPSP